MSLRPHPRGTPYAGGIEHLVPSPSGEGKGEERLGVERQSSAALETCIPSPLPSFGGTGGTAARRPALVRARCPLGSEGPDKPLNRWERPQGGASSPGAQPFLNRYNTLP